MKSVLLHMNEDLGEESRLQASLDLVRAFGGHLQCIEAVPFPAYIDDELSDGMAFPLIVSQLEAQIDDRLEKRRRSLQKRVQAEGLPWDWICRHGDAANIVATQAHLADIVVLSHAPGGERYQHALPLVADLLMKSRSPVLAVPEQWPSLDLIGQALVAWDGSAEAAAALRLAVPLLRLAELVHVVTVSSERVELPPLDPALYLSRHGIACGLHQCPKEGTVADTLMNFAQELKVGFIVMGSYGHGRVSEYLFGGVTRAMLHSAAMPILLAR